MMVIVIFGAARWGGVGGKVCRAGVASVSSLGKRRAFAKAEKKHRVSCNGKTKQS